MPSLSKMTGGGSSINRLSVAERIGRVPLPPPSFIRSLPKVTISRPTKTERVLPRRENISTNGGVSNPYGAGINAYEPGTSVFESIQAGDIPVEEEILLDPRCRQPAPVGSSRTCQGWRAGTVPRRQSPKPGPRG